MTSQKMVAEETIHVVVYHGISHLSSEKKQVTCGIFHGIPLESIAFTGKYYFTTRICLIKSTSKHQTTQPLQMSSVTILTT